MRTLITTAFVGLALAASPAFAQQHPWVPSGEPVGSLPNGAPAVSQHPWVPSFYAGTGSLPNGEPAARAESRVRGGGAGTRHQGRQSGN